MTRIIHIAVLTLSLTLAACGEKTKTYQGWVEANLIFVAPDEAGRIEALEVREGTPVETGAPLFSVDEQLQRADLNLNMAQLTMARQTFDRAQQ
ncbi:MAG: efflux RND transporter periplasmic adaptor subunit, partial [Xanthobacteraceae bacterium]